ncbi:unnamed protein product [Danaus chrysippus]|uniref:(African queen) hypothetical protein n=1 Tax=Danaus chrysippus TaxID=151541 RepID=A0A8J2R6V0_9NEOP|nr:unnamed protein product [Danaus chrysippus]
MVAGGAGRARCRMTRFFFDISKHFCWRIFFNAYDGCVGGCVCVLAGREFPRDGRKCGRSDATWDREGRREKRNEEI